MLDAVPYGNFFFFFFPFLFFLFLFFHNCAMPYKYCYVTFTVIFLFFISIVPVFIALPYCTRVSPFPQLQGNQFLPYCVCVPLLLRSCLFHSFLFLFSPSCPSPSTAPAPFGTGRLAGIEACMHSSSHGYSVFATPIPVYYIISYHRIA